MITHIAEGTYIYLVDANNFVVGDKADVDKAVKAAKAAFPGWRSIDPSKRIALMLKLADLIEEHADELAAYVICH